MVKIMLRPVIFIFSFLLILSLATAIDEAPMLPAFYHGSAILNGRLLPSNSIIIAKIDGSELGLIITTQDGYYGNANTSDKLGVTGNSSMDEKEIKFYAQTSSMANWLEAAETSTWSSGTIKKVDLTFTGTEEPKPSGGTTTGGGGGGGGGTVIAPPGTNETTTPPETQPVIPEIKSGVPFEFNYFPGVVSVTKIRILTNQTLKEPDMSITELKTVQNPVDDMDVYTYLQVQSNIQDSSLDTAIIWFKVENSWFDKGHDRDKLKVMRFESNNWKELTTINEGNDSTDTYYRALTPGFSYFAIVSEKLPTPPSAPITPPNKRNVLTGFLVFLGSSGVNLVVGIVFVIVIALLLVILFLVRKKK